MPNSVDHQLRSLGALQEITCSIVDDYDSRDSLAHFKEQFNVPDLIYLDGELLSIKLCTEFNIARYLPGF